MSVWRRKLDIHRTARQAIRDSSVPLKVHFRRFRVGSGGKGEFRGGNGQEILFESRAPGPVTVAFLAERTRGETAPMGIAGGEAGACGELIIDGKPVNPKSQHFIERGGPVLIRTPAGGGYGAKGKRAQERVDADRSEGYVA